MRHFNNSIVVALATLLLLVSISSAQQTSTTAVPNLVRYSGTLKDAQGAALSSSTAVGVTFSIYKQQDGGAAVWMETQNVTPDSNGQYNVILGNTTATGLPDDLFLQQEQRWLGVQVQGEAEQARVLLVSVPYAFKAHEAETLGGLPASAFVKAPPSGSAIGTYGDGTAVNALGTPGNAGVRSKGRSAAASGNNTICSPLTANGSANYIPLFDPTVCNLVNSTIYQSGFLGYIGISAFGFFTNPGTQLDVQGAINASPVEPVRATYSDTGNYQISYKPVLSIGWPDRLVDPARHNLYVGVEAGAQGFVQNYPDGDTGIGNTFIGYRAAFHNQSGSTNTAVGAGAGFRNTTGNNNTSVGVDAAFGVLGEVVSNNTIMGYAAGLSNTGSNNSFFGYQSGVANTADGNSFYGYQAGYSNTMASGNAFFGYQAGYSTAGPAGGAACCNSFFGSGTGLNNTTGFYNTFSGYQAGRDSIDGIYNTFYGATAGISNTHGSGNTFLGFGTGSLTTGTAGENTFVGDSAGQNNTGGNNTFVGSEAGLNATTGSYNVYVANQGPVSFAESDVIRIGSFPLQSAAYIAGIFNSTGTPTSPPPFQAVCVDTTGLLFGTTPLTNCMVSSRRFKEQIADMGDSSSKLFQLRPVTFFYKPQYDDGSHSLQYGLIAEEVAQVYPEMAAYDKDGQPYSVKYQLLAPMLLNELQKQHTVVAAQQDELQTQLQQIKAQQQQMQAQRQEIDGLKLQLQQQNASLQERLSKLESYVATQMKVASDNPPRTTPGANGGLQ